MKGYSLPCPCKVGPGKEHSFEALEEELEEVLHSFNPAFGVRSLYVVGEDDHADGVDWFLEVEDKTHRRIDDDFEDAVREMAAILKGSITAFGKHHISVRLNCEPCS